MATRTGKNGRDRELEHIREDINSLKHNVVALSRSLSNGMREEANHKMEMIKHKSADTMHRLEDNVRQRPGQSMLLAFLGGLLTSAVLKPR